jgi:hypothetical protein
MAAIYQADVWCDDCANAIRKRLLDEGRAPESREDEYLFDSDEYPKIASDDEESDSPQHCAAHESCLNAIELPSGRKVGLLFGGLTTEGVRFVREVAIDDSSEVFKLWVQHFTEQGYDLELTECLHCGGFVDAA